MRARIFQGLEANRSVDKRKEDPYGSALARISDLISRRIAPKEARITKTKDRRVIRVIRGARPKEIPTWRRDVGGDAEMSLLLANGVSFFSLFSRRSLRDQAAPSSPPPSEEEEEEEEERNDRIPGSRVFGLVISRREILESGARRYGH